MKNNDLSWLPDSFTEKMRQQLDNEEEFDSFIASYREEHWRGMRCNTLKLSPERFEEICPFEIEKVRWIQNGYYSKEDEQPAKHPYYYAGLYYIQEPSAMTPASLLPIEEGDAVLDLCAAPGGKTTELGARLKGKGVLVCNDISNSRAKALLKNVELFGIRNAAVISEAPDKLAEKFEGFFDKILVDAPCSGEGMFRKSHTIVKNWEQYGVDYYAKLQRQIMPSAIRMLKPGGYMIFSTCTFSTEEDEGTLSFICENYPEMEVVPVIDFSNEKYEGFTPGYGEFKSAVRLFPHKVRGEGHFVALLRKKDISEGMSLNIASEAVNTSGNSLSGTSSEERKCFKNSYDTAVRKRYKAVSDEAFDFLERLGFEIRPELLEVREDRLYLLPSLELPLRGLRILRTGLLLGEMKKGRFEPSQALASSLKAGEYENVLNLGIDDDRVVKYLKCDTIDIGDDEAEDGWCLMMVEGYSLGWGKVQGGRFKNKYLPGWRML